MNHCKMSISIFPLLQNFTMSRQVRWKKATWILQTVLSVYFYLSIFRNASKKYLLYEFEGLLSSFIMLHLSSEVTSFYPSLGDLYGPTGVDNLLQPQFTMQRRLSRAFLLDRAISRSAEWNRVAHETTGPCVLLYPGYQFRKAGVR